MPACSPSTPSKAAATLFSRRGSRARAPALRSLYQRWHPRLFGVRSAFRSCQSQCCALGTVVLGPGKSPWTLPLWEQPLTWLKRFPWHHQLVGPEFEQTPGEIAQDRGAWCAAVQGVAKKLDRT